MDDTQTIEVTPGGWQRIHESELLAGLTPDEREVALRYMQECRPIPMFRVRELVHEVPRVGVNLIEFVGGRLQNCQREKLLFYRAS